MQLRHPVTNKLILNSPICVDDWGNMVFICQYTKQFVSTDNAIFMGPVMPNVVGTYVCVKDVGPAYRQSKNELNAYDANCNSCTHLQRIKHDKNTGGFLYGKCAKGHNPGLYQSKESVIMFHPDDPMLMTCWESRK